MCLFVLWLCCVCFCLRPCVYGDCGRLHGCMHVCECVGLYVDCVVFVCAPVYVCKVIVGVCICVCMFLNVCACIVIVLCLYVPLAMFVW